MDPLSWKLNAKHQKVRVGIETGMYITNHLLFIDDLTLLTENSSELEAKIKETKDFFCCIGLEINKDKLAKNCKFCSKAATLLEGLMIYKYLGIIDTAKSSVSTESLKKLRNEILKRVKALCETKLNAKNLFKAKNEHAISVINYHVDVLRLKPEQYAKLDNKVRKVLTINKVYLQPANEDRLYLLKKLLGRKLCSIEHKSEHMLLKLQRTLDTSQHSSLRRAAILKVEKDN